MAGKLDEISRAIGSLETAVIGLGSDIKEVKQSIEKNRELQSVRHKENREDIAELKRDVREQGEKLDQHANSVSALQVSRGRLVGLASVGLLALWLIGRAIEAGLQWVVGRIFEGFH
jgi:septal ring factor EnvC (AmiA/AmiB activator)